MGAAPQTAVDELIAHLIETKRKLDSMTNSTRRFELSTQEVLELTYISQRIDYYLKVYAGKREPRSFT